MNFGQPVLSHPLLVEAIHGEFIPVAIYNNKPGDDAKVLARYKEPSWNNPVVRFVGPDGEDLIPRRDRIWDSRGIAARTVAALRAAKRNVPEYLRLLALGRCKASMYAEFTCVLAPCQRRR